MLGQLPDFQTSTLLLAGATLVGAFVGAGAQLYLGRVDANRTRENLRVALKHELKENAISDSEDINSLGRFKRGVNQTTHDVYDAEVGNLGLLTNVEAESIVAYYTYLKGSQDEIKSSYDYLDRLSNDMRNWRNLTQQADTPREGAKKQRFQRVIAEKSDRVQEGEFLNHEASELENRRKRALNAVEKQL